MHWRFFEVNLAEIERRNMGTQTATKSYDTKSTQTPASIVWFEIPADNVERARKFYGALFGWKIEKFPAAVMIRPTAD